MFRKITITFVGAALSATAAITLTASPASALRSMDYSGEDTTYTAEPHTMEAEDVPDKYISGTDDDFCVKQTNAANSWIDAAVQAWYDGDSEAQSKAQANADAIAGEANAQGCIIYD